MEPIVDLREIEKSYTVGGEQLHVLKKVSLFANQGEYIAILGASGSGKSTLMNIIGCMDTPDTGSYFLAVSLPEPSPDCFATSSASSPVI